MKNKKWLVIAAVFLFVYCLSWTKTTDFSQDLGRHLKLGEIITRSGHVPDTNLFSYTNPAFPFTNHHWLSEVIYYVLTSAFGLVSLYWLRLVLLSGAVLLFLKGKSGYMQYISSICAALLFLPLLSQRVGLRPELFGYFFFSLLLYIIFFQKNRRLHYLIPVVMVLWVNLHISFVFGLLLIGVGFLQAVRQKQSLYAYMGGMLVVLLNPNGIRGALEPFTIFGNYGYSIVENQNIFFLNTLTFNPNLRYYLFLSPIVIYAIALLLFKKQYHGSFILAVFYILGMWQVRHIPFLVLTALFFFSQAITYSLEDMRRLPFLHRHTGRPFFYIVMIALFVVSASFVFNLWSKLFDSQATFGYGYYENQKEATNFILEHRLPGRLFNNFDIGGYAIYRLYPQYQVFVDNRPEAYPSDFFRNIYIPLQENDSLRKKIFQQYGIHTVMFAHADMTPWGKSFVPHIFGDASWKLVFLNSDVFVMSDQTDLPDIRANSAYLQRQIDENNDPVSLLNYASFLSSININTFAGMALQKAKQLNPLSCSISRIEYATQTSPDYFLNGSMENKAWWCY